MDFALAVAGDGGREPSTRVAALEAVAESGDTATVPRLLELAAGASVPDAVQAAALRALGRFDRLDIPPRVLAAYPSRPADWRSRARDLLLGRKAGAVALLDAIEAGRIDAKDVPLDQVGRIASLRDAALGARVRAIWGRVAGPTPEERLAEVRRLNNDLRASPGDAVKGRDLFRKHCATCHRLHGEGNLVGPDLTGASRSDRDWLLVSLVDPSGIVRKEYAASLIGLKDGRGLTGLLAEDSPDHVTIVDARAERTTIPRGEIDSIADSPASLMPEGLYRELSPRELRDLFAYLQTP
jgi:putative heme-binding domain-containing protein